MKMSDRFTKVLLTLLVIGVWGLLLTQFFHGPLVEAQSTKLELGTYKAPPNVTWEYTFYTGPDKQYHGKELNELGSRGWEAIGEIGGSAILLKRKLE